MNVLLLAGLAWWLLGFAGFAYWWTTEFDLDLGDAAFGATIPALTGPFAWWVGWLMHGKPLKWPSRLPVLLRRR